MRAERSQKGERQEGPSVARRSKQCCSRRQSRKKGVKGSGKRPRANTNTNKIQKSIACGLMTKLWKKTSQVQLTCVILGELLNFSESHLKNGDNEILKGCNKDQVRQHIDCAWHTVDTLEIGVIALLENIYILLWA